MDAQLVVGTKKGLFEFARTSEKWSVVRHSHLGIPVLALGQEPNSTSWWAALDHGHWGTKLHRSEDRGATWGEISPPTYPKGAVTRSGDPATLSLIWCFAFREANEGPEVLLGTGPGGVFRTRDNGESFQLLRGLWDHPTRVATWDGGGFDFPAVHSIVIDQTNPQRFLVAISTGGVYETLDGGESWHPRNAGLPADYLPERWPEAGQDPHLLVSANSSASVLWQQNHCGLFRSIDGGTSWYEISSDDEGPKYGFAIAASDNLKEAWVIPFQSTHERFALHKRLTVYRTVDSGQTWWPCRSGLPEEHSYDLVYRHALALQGNQLAFGTTSGNLYWSEDRGEHWSVISHNLPQVNFVQWVSPGF